MTRRSGRRCQIRPRGRNVGAGAIRQNQHQMELPLAFKLAKHLQHLARQSVMRTCDPNVWGKLSEGGSVSGVLSILSTTTG
jgi:hypothetical protein